MNSWKVQTLLLHNPQKDKTRCLSSQVLEESSERNPWVLQKLNHGSSDEKVPYTEALPSSQTVSSSSPRGMGRWACVLEKEEDTKLSHLKCCRDHLCFLAKHRAHRIEVFISDLSIQLLCRVQLKLLCFCGKILTTITLLFRCKFLWG